MDQDFFLLLNIRNSLNELSCLMYYIIRKIRTVLQKLQRTFTVNSSIWYVLAVFVVQIMMENNQEALCLFFPLFYSVFACHLQPCTLCLSTCSPGHAAPAWEWSSDALLSSQAYQSSFTQPDEVILVPAYLTVFPSRIHCFSILCTSAISISLSNIIMLLGLLICS